MKAAHPNSITPQAMRLIKRVIVAAQGNDGLKLARATFNLQCHIHRAEVKSGAITEPVREAH